MRKLAPLLIAAMAMGVTAAPAAAQDKPVTKFVSKAKVVPKKAGTKRNPRGVQVRGSLRFNTITQGVEPPIVTGGTILLPKQGRYNGGRYPKCSVRAMRRAQSIDPCPKRSIMGNGSGVAFADRVDARPKVTFVNGGKNTLWAFTTLYAPALVREPIRIRIAKLRSKRWGYRATFKVPDVLQVVAGVPITLRKFNYRIGRRPYARNFFTTIGCPRNNRYPYVAKAGYLYNDGTRATSRFRGNVPCR